MSPQIASSPDTTKVPTYVRPGLNMTARDLDEAKHLILDLLGLGVTPEYLVDCGVSPQCLAICFYELNLRFPLNLDRHQINLPPFYDLDKHMKDSQRREQIIRQRDRGRVPQKPTPVIVTATAKAAESSRTSKSTLPTPSNLGGNPVIIESSPTIHPDVINDPSGAVGVSSLQPTEAAQPSSSKAVDIASIEDQKRMELLARKAAMDSITKKRAKNSSLALNSPEQSTTQPHPMEIKDVESAVDALLASVRMDSESSNQSEDGSGKEREDESVVNGEQLPDYDSDAMVEDELETRSPSPSDSDTIDQPMDTPVLADTQRNSSPEPILTTGPALILSPKPSVSRVRFSAPDSARSSSLPAQPTPIAVPVVARRSRPIASDFIDQVPPRPASASRSGYERNALKRKRSFVDPAVWPKRIVIDLDSSDEEDDQDEGTPAGAAGSSSSSSKSSVDRAPSRTGSHDKTAMAGQDQAAQMLLEKELQIKAMMQKIKMRELQKRKTASGSRTPVPTASTPTATADPSKTGTPSVEPTSSPVATTTNITPVATPNTEVPPAIPEAQQVLTPILVDEEKHSASKDPSDTTSPKADKGKGKALEPEGIPPDNVTVVSSVAQSGDEARLDQSSNSNDNEQAPTRFKAYVSPLAGFTSPHFQRSSPTDQQLSTIFWISSSAGRNVDRQLCMYEFPSGICRNEGCKDIHARDFGASNEEIRKTASTMFPNARPENLTEIVARVRQSVQSS